MMSGLEPTQTLNGGAQLIEDQKEEKNHEE
jgi:hypothetical protein